MFLNEIKAIEGGKPGNIFAYLLVQTRALAFALDLGGHCRTCLLSLYYLDKGSAIRILPVKIMGLIKILFGAGAVISPP